MQLKSFIYFIPGRGNTLIGARLEVQYNRVNLDGSTEYISLLDEGHTIAAWNRSQGYLVNFEDGDQEWLQSVEEQGVRLFDQKLIVCV